MQDFEKLGVFYLGRRYDLKAGRPRPDLLLYDSKDLVTHAVCVGMTGSGKTGLCLALLEEAAIDGIPAIVIDPKGDLANLLLTFPEPAPRRLRAVDRTRTTRAQGGCRAAEFAAKQAETWKKGLAEWGQDGERIRRLRECGRLRHLHARQQRRPAGVDAQVVRRPAARRSATTPKRFRERVSGTVTSLLGLLGIDADPVQSREHILLSTILDDAWTNGKRPRPRPT